MQRRLPTYTRAHIAAFTGVLLLHSALVVWPMLRPAPVILPPQQVIRIAMVASPAQTQHSSTNEVAQQPVEERLPSPPVPPADKGMKKAEPYVEPLKKPQEVAPAKPVAESSQRDAPSDALMDTAETKEQHAVLTEPVAAAYLNNPPPVYPRIAQRRHWQGTVKLLVRVGGNGLPLAVSLAHSSGYPVLDDAALDAVRRWRFVPAMRGDKPVEASVVVPVAFRLN